ncbi:MAG: aldo/keto reductase [Eggerthellaceae bacterium]|nr:aldo/keto reductase [Eggerthellaceae bacterium]
MIDPKTVPSFKLNDGGVIPCVGMGTFGSDRVTPEEVAGAVAGGLRAGYRLFDCAACYGNEDQIGQVFKADFDEGVVERKDLFIMSKVWNDMHRRVRESCLKSISDLQCDYLDMLFIHWPFPNYHAPFCDVDSRNPDSRPFSVAEFVDTYRQIEALVDEGLVKHIGISNLTIPKLDAVLPKLRIKPAACESELHPCFQQQALFDYLVAHDILPIGYMPLGSPRRPERDILPEDIADMQMPELQEIAKAHNCHPAIICLKWALQRGQLPIPFSVHNYEANLAAAVTEKLTDAEMATIATLERNNRLVKGQVFLWPGANDWHDLWDEDGVIVDCTDC